MDSHNNANSTATNTNHGKPPSRERINRPKGILKKPPGNPTDTSTDPRLACVQSVLASHPIELRESICNLALTLLKSHNDVLKHQERLEKFTTDEGYLPQCLRFKVQLQAPQRPQARAEMRDIFLAQAQDILNLTKQERIDCFLLDALQLAKHYSIYYALTLNVDDEPTTHLPSETNSACIVLLLAITLVSSTHAFFKRVLQHDKNTILFLLYKQKIRQDKHNMLITPETLSELYATLCKAVKRKGPRTWQTDSDEDSDSAQHTQNVAHALEAFKTLDTKALSETNATDTTDNPERETVVTLPTLCPLTQRTLITASTDMCKIFEEILSPVFQSQHEAKLKQRARARITLDQKKTTVIKVAKRVEFALDTEPQASRQTIDALVERKVSAALAAKAPTQASPRGKRKARAEKTTSPAKNATGRRQEGGNSTPGRKRSLDNRSPGQTPRKRRPKKNDNENRDE